MESNKLCKLYVIFFLLYLIISPERLKVFHSVNTSVVSPFYSFSCIKTIQNLIMLEKQILNCFNSWLWVHRGFQVYVKYVLSCCVSPQYELVCQLIFQDSLRQRSPIKKTNKQSMCCGSCSRNKDQRIRFSHPHAQMLWVFT